MRVSSAGVRRTEGIARLLVNGRPIEGRPGDSIAAALIDAGVLTCRVEASGEERGVFCGMGVCQECVMLIDGTPARACMTALEDGMNVTSYAGLALEQPKLSMTVGHIDLAPELLVVGGGPGGLVAAATAAEGGVATLVVDERSKLGGQYYKQPSPGFEVDEEKLDRQYREGRALIRRLERSGAERLGGVAIWGASGPHELLAVGNNRSYTLRPRRLVIATGAYERAVPLPGWTLPGFMTTGAAQTLLRSYQVLPGRRVLIAGNGPLNLQVATEIVRSGGTVVGLCETARSVSASRAPALARMAAAAPSLMLEGLRSFASLRRARVPALFGHTIVRVEGAGRVQRAYVARLDALGFAVPDSERAFDVDAVCVGFGFLPSNELARSIGVPHRFDLILGQLVAVATPSGRTELGDVWVVGDSGGTGGARLAKAVGALAGVEVVRSLGKPLPVALTRSAKDASSARRRNVRFQRALGRLYTAPRLSNQLAEPETVVCRCEDVSLGAIDAAFDGGVGAIGAVKRVTRAGMGRCQGRYCASVLADISARRSDIPLSESDWFAPAPPFKPLPMGVIAQMGIANPSD